VRREVSHSSVSLTQAAEILGTPDLGEAQRLARIELWFARLCPVCRLTLRHLPAPGDPVLAREFVDRLAPWERDEHSLRLIAAWILLHGW